MTDDQTDAVREMVRGAIRDKSYVLLHLRDPGVYDRNPPDTWRSEASITYFPPRPEIWSDSRGHVSVLVWDGVGNIGTQLLLDDPDEIDKASAILSKVAAKLRADRLGIQKEPAGG